MKVDERVQIDHMTVTKNGITVKHFQASARKSKFIHAQVYSHAKAPFKIKSIQIDGGAEFMAEFEQACEDMKIPIIALPQAGQAITAALSGETAPLRKSFIPEKTSWPTVSEP